MLDMIFSRVLLPEPLRPTIPKNSPWWTSNDTSRSARSSRYSVRVSGWTARSLNESTRCSGIRKVLWTPRTSITTGPRGRTVGGSECVGWYIWLAIAGLLKGIYTHLQCNESASHDRIRLFYHEARRIPTVRGTRHPPRRGIGLGD